MREGRGMKNMRSKPVQGDDFYQEFLIKKNMDLSTGGLLIMSQPDGLLILGGHPFLNYIFFWAEGVYLYRGVY